MEKKHYGFIKAIIFILLGILVLCFHEFCLGNDGARVPVIVGTAMLLYGVDGTLFVFVTKEFKEERLKVLESVITLMLGIIVLTFRKDASEKFITICVLWAVWAIMREASEIYEKVFLNWENRTVALISLAESIVIIVFSVMMILTPTMHHAKTHMILLGVELTFEGACFFANGVYKLVRQRREKSIVAEVAATDSENKEDK